MSGGQRYWNEDTQRWEDGTQGSPQAGPTLPPPARPESAPGAVEPGAPPPESGAASAAATSAAAASGAAASGAAASGAAASGAATSGAATPTAPPTTPPAAPASGAASGAGGWPGGGAGSAWHGPGGAGGTVVDGGSARPPASGPAAGDFGAWPMPEWTGSGSWPPQDQSSPPAPDGGLNRRLVWSVVVGAAVVGVAVSLVLTLVVGKGGDDGKRPVAAGSSTTSTSSPRQSPSPSVMDTALPSASASAPPAGYRSYDDEEGFRIAVPEGWTRSTVASAYGIAVVNYRSADREHRLQVYQVQEESPEASFKLYLSDQTPKPAGFEKLGLQKLDDGQFTGSRLEYLADTIRGEPDVGTWHVYDERFVAADGNIYAIASYGPDSDGRDDELAHLTAALDWFCPPYTTCDADPGID